MQTGVPRQRRDSVFNSPQRQLMLRLIEQNPGITLTELMAKTQNGWGTLYHHLASLSDAGLIRTRTAGRRRLIFAANPTAGSHEEAVARSILCGDTANRVARAILAHPGRSVTDICEELNDSPRAIYYHVRRLRDAGLISSASPTRHFDLMPTELLCELIQAALDPKLHE